MPDMKDIGASVSTGPASSIKLASKNMQTEAAKAKAKANAEAAKIPVDKGAVSYRTMGAHNFAIKPKGGLKEIVFNSSRYVTSDPEEQKILDGCVARKLLRVETDNR